MVEGIKIRLGAQDNGNHGRSSGGTSWPEARRPVSSRGLKLTEQGREGAGLSMGSNRGGMSRTISGFLVFCSLQTSSSALWLVASLHMNQKRLTFLYL